MFSNISPFSKYFTHNFILWINYFAHIFILWRGPFLWSSATAEGKTGGADRLCWVASGSFPIVWVTTGSLKRRERSVSSSCVFSGCCTTSQKGAPPQKKDVRILSDCIPTTQNRRRRRIKIWIILLYIYEFFVVCPAVQYVTYTIFTDFCFFSGNLWILFVNGNICRSVHRQYNIFFDILLIISFLWHTLLRLSCDHIEPAKFFVAI